MQTRDTNHRQSAAGHRRSGAAVFEFVVFAPVLLIFVAAIVEFGLVFANLQTVELSSRMAAKVAAEASQADVTSGNATLLMNIRSTADDVLAAGGMSSSGVVLQHTLGGGNGSFTNGTCSAPATPPMPAEAVRVTVCVDLSQLTPDLLNTFGFSTTGRTGRQTTTLRFEGP